FHNADVQDAMLDGMRFWLERGIDGFRLDTVNFYFHSLGLESNPVVKPEDFNASTAPAVNPYNFQEHLYDKSQPENLAFLRRLRRLMDEYGDKVTVGEIGDSQHQLEVMAAYTSGTDKLHMAYTFDYLGGEFSAAHFKKSIELTEAQAPEGWICLAFSNHDVVRHISRWATHGQQEEFTRLAATLLLSMRGSVCLYQGEELGLTEAELAFEDLVDPYGIEFWPQFKGRDGCRTPMVWQTQSQLGGFTTATRAWLPVPADHLTKAVDRQVRDPHSVLSHYRAMLAFRHQHPALIKGTITTLDAPEGVLAFLRQEGTERLYCVFNMSEKAVIVPVPAGFDPAPSGAPGIADEPIEAALSLAPFGAYIGVLR
ncbi:MAG: alpha-amylase family glycosyl hydrolase, partial [Devosia sp.]|nr:alpha-amylase family glycosyl hydrolase [Devosia sp.]